jgi:hypothetical protein
MVLQNIIVLEPGVPAKFHFYDHHIDTRTITDPVTGQPAIRHVLVFNVDRLNDQPVESTYSTMAEKHASQFSPYLVDKSYRNFDFTITVQGEGFRRSWTVQVTPRPA